ncbi:hypothetical protein BC629DRAFT_1464136 [Irpex lacteus]|nr:hypothetical protein BC629DRAFT_1464136 [Irpex lacteus]
MLTSPAVSNASLPGGFWAKFQKTPKGGKEMNLMQDNKTQALTRQRLLTICFGDMETIRMLPTTFAELEAVCRDWIKPPPDAEFGLRVPVEYASLHASRLVSGPYIYVSGKLAIQVTPADRAISLLARTRTKSLPWVYKVSE